MEINRVCVIGGSGFLGSCIVTLLSERRFLVRVPTRRRDHAKHLILLPTVDVIEADVHDEAQLAALLQGMDAVINLAGVLHNGHGTQSFEQTHVKLTRKIIAACRNHGVRRLVHMSALGASPQGLSKYQRSKGQGEALVRDCDLDWTILRPSVVFGRGDSFLSMFAVLLDLLPVVFLACPHTRFQPVFVEDVAAVVARCLADRTSFQQAYDLCGPRVYTLRELVELVGHITGRLRPVIGLNDTLSYLQASFMGLSPVKLLTRDNYYSMKTDNVSSAPFAFGIKPAALEAIAPAYLGNNTPRGRYRSYRDHAGRSWAR